MSKRVKDLITRELQTCYADVDSACVVSLQGLDAVSTNQLRAELKAKNIRLRVVKNSLARRAFAGTRLEPLGERLEGPCALVTGGESIVDVAKELVRWSEQLPAIELKQGIIEGDPDLVPVEQIARMKSVTELRADLAGGVLGPGRRLAAAISGPAGLVASCLKTLVEKGGSGEPAVEAAQTSG